MHHVRVDGRGVINRVKELLRAADVPYAYKAKLFSFEASEEVLESVLVAQKENEDWTIAVELKLDGAGSEFIASGDAIPTVRDDAPVIRISIEEHAKEHALPEPPADDSEAPATDSAEAEAPSAEAEAPLVDAVLVESPEPAAEASAEPAVESVEIDTATEVLIDAEAAEQARQLAEMAAMQTAPDVRTSSVAPPARSAAEQLAADQEAEQAAAVEQARQLAEMASMSAAPATRLKPLLSPSAVAAKSTKSDEQLAAAQAAADEAAAAEQTRQLAEMAASVARQPRAPAVPRATPTGEVPVGTPVQAATGKRIARVWALPTGYVTPVIDHEVELKSFDTARSIYYRESRGARLRDRVSRVDVYVNGERVDWFPA